MDYRFKWMLLLAFACGQLVMSNVSSAFAANTALNRPVHSDAVMTNCAMNDHCCDFGSPDNCSLCVACAGYAPDHPVIAVVRIRQSYHVADILAPFSLFNSLDPPPPRSAPRESEALNLYLT